MAAVAAAAAEDTTMIDPGVYLEKLSYFSRMLRLEGLSVSPKETADAASVLTVLGFEDREQVKTALRTAVPTFGAAKTSPNVPVTLSYTENKRTFILNLLKFDSRHEIHDV